jgi:uncharacterized coiled-coil protein SlyX
MTPEERAAQFTALTADIDAAVAEMAGLREEIATRQVQLDRLTARFEMLRTQARDLVPRDVPSVVEA